MWCGRPGLAAQAQDPLYALDRTPLYPPPPGPLPLHAWQLLAGGEGGWTVCTLGSCVHVENPDMCSNICA